MPLDAHVNWRGMGGKDAIAPRKRVLEGRGARTRAGRGVRERRLKRSILGVISRGMDEFSLTPHAAPLAVALGTGSVEA